MIDAPERIWAGRAIWHENIFTATDVEGIAKEAEDTGELKLTPYVRVDLHAAETARADAAEAKLAKTVEAFTEIEHVYYMEASNPDPKYIRQMAARMRGIAQGFLDSAALKGGEE